MTKPERITKAQAIRAVRAKLPIVGNKELEQNLECMTGSLAEAYRIGAEEAQFEIARRVERLVGKVSP